MHLTHSAWASNSFRAKKSVTENIKATPVKKPSKETPTAIDNTSDPQEQRHKKMERMAGRAAHKANKTQQDFDEGANQFSNIGSH